MKYKQMIIKKRQKGNITQELMTTAKDTKKNST